MLGDEPTGDLDSATSADIISLFRRINKENGQTLILVTHSQYIANQCDKIIHIADGKVISETIPTKPNGDEKIIQMSNEDIISEIAYGGDD